MGTTSSATKSTLDSSIYDAEYQAQMVEFTYGSTKKVAIIYKGKLENF